MSAAPNPKPTLKKEFLVFFGSLKLAIVLLLLIAVASIIGTVIPQDQGATVITEAKFPEALKTVLMYLKAYDVYHAFWFNFLLALLFLNLAVCTYLRFPPTWRRYQMENPPAPPLASLQEGVVLGAAPAPQRLDMLRKRGYRVAELPSGEYFAEKGKFVRLGPTFIHISLFAIITGAIIGGFTGIKNSVPLMVGEEISSKEVFDTSYIHGALAQAPKPFKIRLDNFRMDFRPTGQVKQYYSDLTITPEDGPPYKKKIWVNEPLIQNGVYFYQSFWGLAAVHYSIGGQASQALLKQIKSGGYVSKPFQAGKGTYVFFARGMEEPAVIVSTKTLEPVTEVVPGQTVTVEGQPVKLMEYQLYSGLETKRDPGIPIVYFGCGILIFGLAMVPVSHREVWVRRGERGWVLAGRTHKGRVMLRKELEAIAQVWGHEPAEPETSFQDIGVKAS